MSNLTIPQALFLLAREDQTGKPLGNYNSCVQPAGAIAELVIIERLALRSGRDGIVDVVSTSPTGSPYLDKILSEVSASVRPRRVQYWISHFYGRRDRIVLIGEELVAKRIVEKVATRRFALFPVTHWRLLRPGSKRMLLSTMETILFDQNKVPNDKRVGTIIALAISGRLLRHNFPRALLRTHRHRISALAQGDWPISVAITQALEKLRTAIKTGIVASIFGGSR